MKVLIFSDVHWSAAGSLVTKYGKNYTVRLEHLIDSMNWVNKLAVDQGCACMICGGDMMDKSQCSDIELTALREINWNNLPCYFLCGNHESSVADLKFSSVKALESKRHFIISSPQVLTINNVNICFLPYVVESDRKPISEYFKDGADRNILISHNDIAGIDYGVIKSKIGFQIQELSNNFKLVLNGHLHNSSWVADNVLNVGSLMANNFTNDSEKYSYGCWILDTEDYKLTFFENPHALNFYKIDILEDADLEKLANLKQNAVLSLKCLDSLVAKVREIIDRHKNIIESRIIVTRPTFTGGDTALDATDLAVDHLSKFYEVCKEKIENTEILEQELAEVLK